MRERKLLLSRQELNKWLKKVKDSGLTIVPVKLFISDKGFAKLNIALAKGKKEYDKRDDIKKRDIERELNRKFKMKKNKVTVFFCFCLAALLFTSCGKGYDVRFSNYYIEDMDSVVIGNDKIIFTNIKWKRPPGTKPFLKVIILFCLFQKARKNSPPPSAYLKTPAVSVPLRSMELSRSQS